MLHFKTQSLRAASSAVAASLHQPVVQSIGSEQSRHLTDYFDALWFRFDKLRRVKSGLKRSKSCDPFVDLHLLSDASSEAP
jgi:hypothetical protein